MARSVTVARSHDESSGGRSVAGLLGSVTGKFKRMSVGMEMQRVGTEV